MPFSEPVKSSVLVCRDIVKRFGSAALAVNGVSFELTAGELLGLLGPSGCGKTTLLRLVAGFEQPQSGEILLSERTVCGGGQWLPPEQRQVGIVFQDYALFPHLSVMDNVAFGLKQLSRRKKLPRAQIKVLATEAIELVSLSGMEQRFPHELSGGQQQRVALARALAPRPSLILLDEPFSNLDVQVRLRLRQEVRDILKSIGASGIFVTHDQEEALAIADKVAVMQNGQIVQFDTPENIYQNPRSRFVAEFVTQANFVTAEQHGETWKTEIGPVANLSEPAQTTVGELMIAQEDLKIETDPQGDLIVQGRQFLGREYQYSLLMPSGKVLWIKAGTHLRIEVGTHVRVAVDPSRVKFFATHSQATRVPQKAMV